MALHCADARNWQLCVPSNAYKMTGSQLNAAEASTPFYAEHLKTTQNKTAIIFVRAFYVDNVLRK
jgi:hypothetical protein